MEIFLDLFNDWVGILSLITVLTILVMIVYFGLLFHGDIDEEGHIKHEEKTTNKS